jgi:hypothetical protein
MSAGAIAPAPLPAIDQFLNFNGGQFAVMERKTPPRANSGALDVSTTLHGDAAYSIAASASPAQDQFTNATEQLLAADSNIVMLHRGRLKNARMWFTHLGWKVLPQDQRGRSILRWGADQAYLGSPANPERGVRRWCRCWDPKLTAKELDELVAYTRTSNKRWTHDQSAMVLGITIADSLALNLHFIGANDDPDFEVRGATKRAKEAKRARRSRAARSTGRKPGRPALDLTPEERKARRNAADRMKYHSVKNTVTLLKRRKIDIGSVTGFLTEEATRGDDKWVTSYELTAQSSVLCSTGSAKRTMTTPKISFGPCPMAPRSTGLAPTSTSYWPSPKPEGIARNGSLTSCSS